MPVENSNLQNLRKVVQQLRREAAVIPKKVSITSKDLITYCEQNKKSDALCNGFKSHKQNPYRSNESRCSLI